MRKRILTTGTTLMLALALGTTGLSGVAFAGEDNDGDDDAPVTTQPAPAPTPTNPVPVIEAPAPVVAPAPAPAVTQPTAKKEQRNTSRPSGSGHGGSPQGTSRGTSTPSTPISTQPVALTTTSTDSGVVPQGGIQAGGGGTATQGGSLLMLAIAMGGFAFAFASGGVALRRRASERGAKPAAECVRRGTTGYGRWCLSTF
jgi:hypothetical protein